jgi:transcriptional regulator with XRE-family HTH domain
VAWHGLAVPKHKPDPALGAVLRRLREQRGESLENVGHHAKVTANTLGRIELAHSGPGWSTVLDIAGALDISLLDLVKQIEAERQLMGARGAVR